MKKRTIITVIILLAAVCAAVFAVLKINKSKNVGEEVSGSESGTKIGSYVLHDKEYDAAALICDGALYESGIDGIYYSLNPVKYYKLNGEKFEKIKPAGSYKNKIEISGETIALDIPFVKQNSRIFGVGEFKNGSNNIYGYAFAVICDMPQAYASTGNAALLIDTGDSGLPAAQRAFSEIFEINTAGEFCQRLFNESNRTTQPDGKLREDWNACTLKMFREANSETAFSLSGKMYSREPEAQLYDVCRTQNGRTEQFADGAVTTWLKTDKDGVFYIVQGNERWGVIKKTFSGQSETVFSHEGSILNDCKIKGDYALDLSTGIMISLLNGKKYDTGESFKTVYDFELSGKTAVIAGKEENRDRKDIKIQKILLLELETMKKTILCANNIMDEATPLFISDGYVFTRFDGGEKAIKIEKIKQIAGG